MSSVDRSIAAAAGYLELGMVDDAWEELESLPPGQRDSDLVVELKIEIYQRSEKWAAARAIAESMATRNPENPIWWISWAYALRREKSIQEARGVLWEAVQLHPGEAVISYNLACYASVLGELDEAKRLLKRVIALDSSFEAMALEDPDLEAVFGASGVNKISD